MTIYRLPNGQETHSAERYLRAWKNLAKKTAEILDSDVVGFDPDILLQSRHTAKSLTLPVWAAARIVSLAPNA